jgi:hypothetical protein
MPAHSAEGSEEEALGDEGVGPRRTRYYSLATGSVDRAVRIWGITCSASDGLKVTPVMVLDTLTTHVLCMHSFLRQRKEKRSDSVLTKDGTLMKRTGGGSNIYLAAGTNIGSVYVWSIETKDLFGAVHGRFPVKLLDDGSKLHSLLQTSNRPVISVGLSLGLDDGGGAAKHKHSGTFRSKPSVIMVAADARGCVRTHRESEELDIAEFVGVQNAGSRNPITLCGEADFDHMVVACAFQENSGTTVESQKGTSSSGNSDDVDSGYEKKAGKAAKWRGSRMLLATTEGQVQILRSDSAFYPPPAESTLTAAASSDRDSSSSSEEEEEEEEEEEDGGNATGSRKSLQLQLPGHAPDAGRRSPGPKPSAAAAAAVVVDNSDGSGKTKKKTTFAKSPEKSPTAAAGAGAPRSSNSNSDAGATPHPNAGKSNMFSSSSSSSGSSKLFVDTSMDGDDVQASPPAKSSEDSNGNGSSSSSNSGNNVRFNSPEVAVQVMDPANDDGHGGYDYGDDEEAPRPPLASNSPYNVADAGRTPRPGVHKGPKFSTSQAGQTPRPASMAETTSSSSSGGGNSASPEPAFFAGAGRDDESPGPVKGYNKLNAGQTPKVRKGTGPDKGQQQQQSMPPPPRFFSEEPETNHRGNTHREGGAHGSATGKRVSISSEVASVGRQTPESSVAWADEKKATQQLQQGGGGKAKKVSVFEKLSRPAVSAQQQQQQHVYSSTEMDSEPEPQPHARAPMPSPSPVKNKPKPPTESVFSAPAIHSSLGLSRRVAEVEAMLDNDDISVSTLETTESDRLYASRLVSNVPQHAPKYVFCYTIVLPSFLVF